MTLSMHYLSGVGRVGSAGSSSRTTGHNGQRLMGGGGARNGVNTFGGSVGFMEMIVGE